MMRLSRIWKLYVIYTVVLIACMTLAGFLLQVQIEKRLEGQLKEDILILAKVIASILPDVEDFSTLDPFCKTYQNMAGVRITVIKKNGKVIGESDRSSIKVDNHLKRPEVRKAVSEGIGTAIRFSDTLDIDMLYVALLIRERNKIIRLAIPMAKVKAIENEVMIFLAIALYLTPLIAIIISFFFARYMTDNGDDFKRNSRAGGH